MQPNKMPQHDPNPKDPYSRKSGPKKSLTTSKQHTTKQNYRDTLLCHSFAAALVSTLIAAYITLCTLDPLIRRGYLQSSMWRSFTGAAIFIAIDHVINYLLVMLVMSVQRPLGKVLAYVTILRGWG